MEITKAMSETAKVIREAAKEMSGATERVYAELTSGEIVELQNDCGCITHNGPHWLHMINLERALNADAVKNFREPKTVGEKIEHQLAIIYMAGKEQARLKRLEAELTSRGIVRLIYKGDSEE